MSHMNWIEEPARLKFLLGEIKLFSVSFPSLLLDAHFTSLMTEQAQSPVPFDRLNAGFECLVIRSQPIQTDLPRLTQLPQAVRYVPDSYFRYYIDLRGSFDDYLKKFSSKSRSTLNRKLKKFAEYSGGEICWRQFRQSEEMREFYRLGREVSLNTYQEKLLDAGLPDSEQFCQSITALAACNQMRGYILFHQGRPVAYLCCPVKDGILKYQYLGYDPQYQQWSPGTVLQHLALQQLFAEDIFRMFDFTEGQGAHKQFFATDSQRCANIYYFRRSPGNLSLLYLHTWLDWISVTVVGMLDRLGLKARLKKFIRSRS